jgi:hypothetical protein
VTEGKDANLTEAGRWVDETGLICYAWPPEGRFKALWDRVAAVTTEEERSALQSLIRREVDENSTIVAYTDDNGEWVDVEPNWENPPRWMDGLN